MQYRKATELFETMIEELRHPPVGVSLPWFPKVTEYLGGLRPREVTLLCAPTGTGKTELLATIAAQIAGVGIPIFAAPVETGDIDFGARTFSTICRKNLNQGIAVPESVVAEMVLANGPAFNKLPLYISNYDDRVKVDELTNVLEYAYTNDGVQVALLDNLNFFLDVATPEQQIIEMDKAIHDLVIFGKKRVPMHIILIVHPKKTLNGRVESEFDIKGSSTAVQECANVCLFNRPTKEDIQNGHTPNQRELVFKKIRKRGYYVNKSIWLSYERGHYTELTHAVTKPIGRARGDRDDLPPGDR